MIRVKLSPDDERWLQEHIKSLPKEKFFEDSTWNMVADRGIEWVKKHESWLKFEAQYVKPTFF